MWCPVMWVMWGGSWQKPLKLVSDDLDELWDWDLFCRVSWCVLAAVWASIFTVSTDRGVVPAWMANGLMLLVSLSQRYTSPLWWSIMYLSVSKYGTNNSIYTTEASCPLCTCPIPSGGSGCKSVTQTIWYVEFTGLHPGIPQISTKCWVFLTGYPNQKVDLSLYWLNVHAA